MVNGLDVTGTIIVNAKNVTIKNTRVTGVGAGCGPTNACGNFVIRVACACTVTISNVELTANPPTTVEHGIRNANGGTINLDHVYQHGNIDALCWCGNGSISDSYSTIHLAISHDHLENIYLDDATLRLVHNTLLQPGAADRQHLREHPQRIRRACQNHLTIDRNLLAGGGFSIYPCAHGTSVGSSQITNNRFARCKTPRGTGRRGNLALHRRPRLLRLLPERRLVRIPLLRVLRRPPRTPGAATSGTTTTRPSTR